MTTAASTQHELLPRIVTGLAFTAAALAVVLMGLRLFSAISLSEPIHAVTSGWEQESLFAMWKYVSGQPVYTDPYSLPFGIAFFNWLFYESYGTFITTVLHGLGLDDAWIPTVGRSFTIIGLVAGTVIARQCLRTLLTPRSSLFEALCWASAVYIMFGPLIGYWGMTVRSDVWGMVFDILAVLVFWTVYPVAPLRAAAVTAVCLFCAWSFKQVDIFSSVAIGLYLLFHGRFRALIVLSATYFVLVGLAVVIGSEQYVRTIFLLPALYGFDIEHVVFNGKNFLTKMTPALVPLAMALIAMAASRPLRHRVWDHPIGRFLMIAIVPLSIFTVAISSKVGAGESYYFTLSFYVTALALYVAKTALEDDGAGVSASLKLATAGALAVGWGLAAVALLLVITGFVGTTSVRSQHANYAETRDCLQELPTPAYVPDMYLALPWMNPSDPPVFWSWNYRLERHLGRPFERGGIGGLIDDGYFATVLATPDTVGSPLRREDVPFSRLVAGPVDQLDGASLDHYRETGETCGNYVVLERIPVS